MKVFKIDHIADYLLKEPFTFGFQVYSGMVLPEYGEMILAIMEDRKLKLQIVSAPDISVSGGVLVCTFMVRLDTRQFL